MPGLAAESAEGHVLTADGEQLAYFLCGPQRWSFRSDQERLSVVQACAVRYSGFTGRRVRVRVTSRPFPESEWARRLDADVRTAPGSGPLPAWDDLLGQQQQRLARLALADEMVFLAVPVEGKPGSPDAAADVAKMTAQLAGPGMDARPVTPGELEYLLHRSCALGTPHPLTMPPPMVAWTEDDLAGFAAQHLDWSQASRGRSVRVTAVVNGQLVERFVVIGTMTRKPVIALPGEKGGGAAPWLKRATVGFNVEWSVIADVLQPEVVTSRMVDVVNAVAAQAAHAREHGEPLRKSLLAQSRQANDVIDDVETNDPLSTWLDVWVRFAVAGRTEQEALDRFQAVADLYAPGFTFEPTRRGMHAAAREFIPGEPLSTTAHRRRMTVTEFAAGMPHVTSLVGDRVGFHIGRTVTSTTSRAVCWHPWSAQEVRDSSGVTVVGGTLGSGKSSLVGSIAHQVATAGIPTVLLDLGGPLARLCDLPGYDGTANATDLMQAEPGALSPYRVIADPVREHYATDAEYMAAFRFAGSRRRMLAQDTLTTLLPAAVASMPRTAFAMSAATRAVGGHRWCSPHSVLDRLEDLNSCTGEDGARAEHSKDLVEHGRFLAGLLRDAAELPQTQLIFPERGTAPRTDPDAEADGYLLQVLTMRGLVTPKDGAKRDSWTLEQTVGAALLNLAAHHTSQQVYGIGDMHRRKLVALDEVGLLTAVASGRALVAQLAADSRKWNLRLILSGMNVAHVTAPEVGIANYIDSLFIGRTVGKQAIADALTACHIELGAGYEDVLPRLSPQPRDAVERLGYRDFVFYDGKGGCETVRVAQPPGVEDALNTTADPTKAKLSRPRLVKVPA